MRIFAFLLIELLLSPLTLTSFVLLQGWAIATSKQQHVSITALAPLSFRWLLHIQGIRPDMATHCLVNNLPALNSALCWGSVGPTLLAANLTGYAPSFFNAPPIGEENIGNMINARTLFFDKALAQSLTTAKQIVLLGAGFDTRLLKFCLNQNLSLFEVDQSATQQAKIKALEQSNIDMSEIVYVPVDFNREDWAVKLQQAGFEAGERSFFLWEGVTYYLTAAIAKESLLKMAEMSGAGSAIAFDVFSASFVSASDEWTKIQPVVQLLSFFGEPFRFGVDLRDEACLSDLLRDTGLQVQTTRLMGTEKGSAFSALVRAVKS